MIVDFSLIFPGGLYPLLFGGDFSLVFPGGLYPLSFSSFQGAFVPYHSVGPYARKGVHESLLHKGPPIPLHSAPVEWDAEHESINHEGPPVPIHSRPHRPIGVHSSLDHKGPTCIPLHSGTACIPAFFEKTFFFHTPEFVYTTNGCGYVSRTVPRQEHRPQTSFMMKAVTTRLHP